MPPRVYRHRPWLAATAFLLALTAALAFPALHLAYRDPGITSIATAATKDPSEKRLHKPGDPMP